MAYGVIPTGFSRKPLAVILAEREQANIDVYGPDIIQTSESPLGQINGILSELEAKLWEVAEDTYQSIDPDQAEGSRLDILARLRLIERAVGETDVSLRQATTNVGIANTSEADFIRALRNIDGVTFVRVFVNDGNTTDANGMTPHSIGVAILGGDDEEIALVARQYIVPGITSFGNEAVEINVDGYCRTVWIIRPVLVPVGVELIVSKTRGLNGCPPPANSAIAAAFYSVMTADTTRPANGVDLTTYAAQMAVSCVYPNVEVKTFRASRLPHDLPYDTPPLTIDFFEIASFALDKITVTVI